MRLASAEGLEGLTIGRLATALDMSKSGVLGHFGSKEELQLAVIDAAADIFTREVADRARGAEPGLPRLLAMCRAWVSYLERRVFPGGCFFTAAAAEFDDRPGRVRNAIAGLATVWNRDLYRQIRAATEARDLPKDTDADQLVFEMEGVILALNNALQLHRDTQAPTRARRALSRLLGHTVTVLMTLLLTSPPPRNYMRGSRPGEGAVSRWIVAGRRHVPLRYLLFRRGLSHEDPRNRRLSPPLSRSCCRWW